VRFDLSNLVEYDDGRIYVRVKHNGRSHKIRLREEPGTPEFFTAYKMALDALKSVPAKKAAPRRKSAKPGSLGWLAIEYFKSAEFTGLDEKSRSARRGVIESCLREPLTPGSKHLMRDCPYLRVDAIHMMMLRDRKVRVGLPSAANNRHKYLGSMFSWAIEARKYKVKVNPTRDVKKAKTVSEGYHTWTVDEVVQYIEKHPLGTQAHLAMCLMLFLGGRRQDTIRLGPSNAKTVAIRQSDGSNTHQRSMVYVPKKTSYRRMDESVKPILPPLDEAIRATPHGIKTYLVTGYGKPYSDAGFGNKMREWCDDAGLPQCTAHGLKKAAATMCADLGASDREMMALFDWTSEKMATAYTRKANNSKLAASAAGRLGSFSWDAWIKVSREAQGVPNSS
jgi:integrase